MTPKLMLEIEGNRQINESSTTLRCLRSRRLSLEDFLLCTCATTSLYLSYATRESLAFAKSFWYGGLLVLFMNQVSIGRTRRLQINLYHENNNNIFQGKIKRTLFEHPCSYLNVSKLIHCPT